MLAGLSKSIARRCHVHMNVSFIKAKRLPSGWRFVFVNGYWHELVYHTFSWARSITVRASGE